MIHKCERNIFPTASIDIFALAVSRELNFN